MWWDLFFMLWNDRFYTHKTIKKLDRNKNDHIIYQVLSVCDTLICCVVACNLLCCLSLLHNRAFVSAFSSIRSTVACFFWSFSLRAVVWMLLSCELSSDRRGNLRGQSSLNASERRSEAQINAKSIPGSHCGWTRTGTLVPGVPQCRRCHNVSIMTAIGPNTKQEVPKNFTVPGLLH